MMYSTTGGTKNTHSLLYHNKWLQSVHQQNCIQKVKYIMNGAILQIHQDYNVKVINNPLIYPLHAP